MKTTNKIILILGLIFIFGFIIGCVKSQVRLTYRIQNNTGCNVEVNWEICEGGHFNSLYSCNNTNGCVFQSISVRANSSINLPVQLVNN